VAGVRSGLYRELGMARFSVEGSSETKERVLSALNLRVGFAPVIKLWLSESISYGGSRDVSLTATANHS
jgi:hypothetical protein